MKKILLLYFLFIHLVIATMLVKSNFLSLLFVKFGLTQFTSEITDFHNETVLAHLRMESQIPEKSIIFLGDSIIQGLNAPSVFDNSINFGIGNDTSFCLLERIQKYQSIQHAEKIIISIGLNDFSRRDEFEIISNFKLIISKIPDTIPIYFCAIFPVDEKALKKKVNYKINKLNKMLKQLFLKYDNCYFFNPGKKMINKEGNLLPEYHTGDGVHLSGRGYGVFINEIKESTIESVFRND